MESGENSIRTGSPKNRSLVNSRVALPFRSSMLTGQSPPSGPLV
ncbi:MAG TPA: hypothetical protein VE262_13140 [Blastocatellia bacterium]|nr:hypothetical protein [Blastocatellia bacterium]